MRLLLKPFNIASHLCWVLLISLTCCTASAAKVTRISWDPPNPSFNKFILEFDQIPKYNVVDNLVESNFFYVDFYGLQQGYKRRLLEIDDDTLLKYVDALSYPDSDVLRLVFYAKQADSRFDIQTSTNPPSIVIYTLPKGGVAPVSGVSVAGSDVPENQATNVATGQSGATTSSVSTQVGFVVPKIPEPGSRLSRQHSSGKKYIIIDPGHGGANGGAKSDIKVGGRFLNEKELTIKFGYELKKLIDNHPDLVGLLTRVDDSNVGLRERVKIAEENRGEAGNLFVSLHLNDAPDNAGARGMEVFFLNQKGTVDAAVREIEEKENSEVGISGSAGGKSLLTSLLTDLEQRKLEDWQYESYIFCRRLEQSLLTWPYFSKFNRGVKNANFVVLKNFEMPAVLLEIGFISNTEELKNLLDPQFQQMTAILVYNAINSYFAENDPSFKPRYVPLPVGAQ